jgi:hypothetical protein
LFIEVASSIEETGTKRMLSATIGAPVSSDDVCVSTGALFQSSLPVWASNAFTTRSTWPTKVAQPLGAIEERTTIGVVRETTPSTTHRAQPFLASSARNLPERLVTHNQSPTTVDWPPPGIA